MEAQHEIIFREGAGEICSGAGAGCLSRHLLLPRQAHRTALQSLLQLCRSSGRSDLALDLWPEIVRSNVSPVHFVFGEVLTACIQVRDVQRLRELLAAWSGGIHRHEKKPVVTATRFVVAFGQMGDIDSAFAAYEAFCGSAAGTPDVGLLMSLVQVCLTCLIDSPLLDLTLIPGMPTCELTIACIASVVGSGST